VAVLHNLSLLSRVQVSLPGCPSLRPICEDSRTEHRLRRCGQLKEVKPIAFYFLRSLTFCLLHFHAHSNGIILIFGILKQKLKPAALTYSSTNVKFCFVPAMNDELVTSMPNCGSFMDKNTMYSRKYQSLWHWKAAVCRMNLRSSMSACL